MKGAAGEVGMPERKFRKYENDNNEGRAMPVSRHIEEG